MASRRDRRPDPRPERFDVRISDPGEIAASLPALLGFRPRESVVLISLTGRSGGRVGLTVRGDLPSPDDEATAAAELVRSVRTDGPAAVLLAVVSETPDVGAHDIGSRAGDGGVAGLPHRGLVREVVVALGLARIPVREALLVRGGRWWAYNCSRPCCAPGSGTPLPDGVTALEAASVASGVVIEGDRSDLAGRITGRGGPARGAMVAACAHVAAECSARVLAVGFDEVAEESWSAVTAAVARCRPGAGQALTDGEVARVVWGLRDRDVRDRALGLATGADATAAETLWTECTRRAPAPLDVAPATLLAVSAWLRGDGAMANVALTRALAGEPTYALARLLAQALARCIPPAELRTLLDAAQAGPYRAG